MTMTAPAMPVLEATNPATGEPLGQVPIEGADGIDAAVRAARSAAPEWDRSGPRPRQQTLSRLADAIEARSEEIALLDARDSGLPLHSMRADVAKSVEYLRYFAGIAGELSGRVIELGGGRLAYTRRRPFGVVGVITAYNHPFYFSIVKTSAALAAGNAVVVKPPEQASLSSILLRELAATTLPAGVLNIVTGGAETGEALVRHPGVSRISFTGGIEAGRKVLAAAGSLVKVATAELGGKNVFVAFPDIDVDVAAKAVAKSMNLLTVAGQSCSSTSLLLAHRHVIDPLVRAVAREFEATPIDLPERAGFHMGCLINRDHRERVHGFVERARAEGASLVVGGEPLDDRFPGGAFYPPTVLGGVVPEMEIAREEVFGPVLAAMAWESVDDVKRAVAATSYGLTANVWSGDHRKAQQLADELPVGLAWVNADVVGLPVGVPFGGVGNSGMARDHSFEELESFTYIKTVGR